MPTVSRAELQEYVDWLDSREANRLHFWLTDETEDGSDEAFYKTYDGFLEHLPAGEGPDWSFRPEGLAGTAIGHAYPWLKDDPWAATCAVFIALTDPISLSVAVNITIGEPPRQHIQSGMTEFGVAELHYEQSTENHVLQLDAVWFPYGIQLHKEEPAWFVPVQHALWTSFVKVSTA